MATRKQIAWRKKFARAAKICRERARRGLERYQTCMKRYLRK